MIAIESFATSNPYANNTYIKQTFRCDENETVHIRLDQERGFATERGFDILTVEWEGYKRELHGSIEVLPNELKQANWFDTESNFLNMQFLSDNDVRDKDGTQTKF